MKMRNRDPIPITRSSLRSPTPPPLIGSLNTGRERVDRSLFQSRGGAGLLVDRRRASFQEDDDEGYGVRRAAFLAGLRDLLCSLHHIPPFPVCRRHLLWRGRLLRSPRVISLFLISRCICCH